MRRGARRRARPAAPAARPASLCCQPPPVHLQLPATLLPAPCRSALPLPLHAWPADRPPALLVDFPLRWMPAAVSLPATCQPAPVEHPDRTHGKEREADGRMCVSGAALTQQAAGWTTGGGRLPLSTSLGPRLAAPAPLLPHPSHGERPDFRQGGRGAGGPPRRAPPSRRPAHLQGLLRAGRGAGSAGREAGGPRGTIYHQRCHRRHRRRCCLPHLYLSAPLVLNRARCCSWALAWAWSACCGTCEL